MIFFVRFNGRSFFFRPLPFPVFRRSGPVPAASLGAHEHDQPATQKQKKKSKRMKPMTKKQQRQQQQQQQQNARVDKSQGSETGTLGRHYEIGRLIFDRVHTRHDATIITALWISPISPAS